MGNLGTATPIDPQRRQNILLFSVFAIATCGLIYELVAGTLASYLLGDSVTQFSTVIGTYLFSMGVGSWLSKYIEGNLLKWFVLIEILVGLVGGCSAPLLFLLFEHISSFRIILYALVSLTGILVGLEIPILMRILKNSLAFKEVVARVFTFDYIGALLAALIFPLLLIPHLGLIRSSLLFGIINTAVAALLLYRFEEARAFRKGLVSAIMITVLILTAGFVYADRIMSYTETLAFQDKVIYTKNTAYQRIVLTRNNRELRLFLNGNLQFSSADEYRYHEALVHPALHALTHAKNVLVLGGGDGLAVREILKYAQIDSITLVDLDPAMTQLFSSNQMLRQLNKNSLSSPKLKVINQDAFNWIRANTKQYDLVVIDFPDPSNYSIGKLYSSRFYEELHHSLSEGGIAVVQSTSPFVARRSFWCITHTLASAGFITIPYHAYVPSFGEWGYVMAMKQHVWANEGSFPAGLRYINAATMKEMLTFPPDMGEVPTEVNKLNNQVLVNYFEDEWAPYIH
ncbi:MAG: polyamine aminopropyltransferase [Bacteroidota bacterium]